MPSKKTVAFGLLGTTLDAGKGSKRWNRWRPTVALCRHEDLVIDRLELLHEERHADMAAFITEDIRAASPETEVRTSVLEVTDPWDFEQVYGALHDFVAGGRGTAETALAASHVWVRPVEGYTKLASNPLFVEGAS